MHSHQISLIATLALVVPYVQDCECDRPDPDPDPGTDQAKLVFVTADLFPGDLGGLAGADLLCTDQARDAGLSGTYTAWLSDSTANAGTRITSSSFGYALVDGTVIADDLADLLDGELDVPITLDQFGEDKGIFVWTNTTASGLAAGAFDCSGWTSSAGLPETGTVGVNTVTEEGWTNSNTGTACSATNRLYCFED